MGIYKQSFGAGIKPDKTLTVSDWADSYRMLPSNASAEPGKYRTKRTPYLKEPMDCLTSNSDVEEVIMIKAAQVGYSEMINNFIGYGIDVSPCSIMLVQPTGDAAKKYSKQRIDPMIEASPNLKKKVSPKNTKEGSNTVLAKDFTGGMLNIVSATSAVSLRSTPVKFLCLDEVDGYPLDTDGEGNPIDLAKKRTTTFSRRKVLMGSTPTIENISVIAQNFKRGDMRYYHVPCPHCKGKQVLKFSNLQFKKDDKHQYIPDSVYYECEFCKEPIKEYHKTWMLDNGEWIATNPEAPSKIRSYHISALYSPLGWKSWDEVAVEWLEAQLDGTKLKLKTFINTVLGETYKENTQQPDWVGLYNRREPYSFFEADSKIVYCCAGLDTQDNRIAIHVIGVGEDNEIWVLAYDEIMGSPSDPQTWAMVRRYVDTPIKHKSGVELHISDCIIDSAGHYTDFVYDFCKKNSDKFIPCVGRGEEVGFYLKQGKTIDIDQFGKKYSNPIILYHVNTILSKKTIYNFLQNETKGARFIHFSDDLQQNYFEMLTSEQLITKIIGGKMKQEFIKPSGNIRNEALDTIGYAYALLYSKGGANLWGKEYQRVWQANIGSKIKSIEEEKEIDTTKLKKLQKPSRINSHNLSFNKR